jgi:hypothetical protein
MELKVGDRVNFIKPEFARRNLYGVNPDYIELIESGETGVVTYVCEEDEDINVELDSDSQFLKRFTFAVRKGVLSLHIGSVKRVQAFEKF